MSVPAPSYTRANPSVHNLDCEVCEGRPHVGTDNLLPEVAVMFAEFHNHDQKEGAG